MLNRAIDKESTKRDEEVLPLTRLAGIESDFIYQFSRRQAIQEGLLVDVSDSAREVGFKIPTAVTLSLWETWIEPTNEEVLLHGQSAEGRLWDVLNGLYQAISLKGSGSDTLFFNVGMIRGNRRANAQMKATCGPGDNGEPVLTILLPQED